MHPKISLSLFLSVSVSLCIDSTLFHLLCCHFNGFEDANNHTVAVLAVTEATFIAAHAVFVIPERVLRRGKWP